MSSVSVDVSFKPILSIFLSSRQVILSMYPYLNAGNVLRNLSWTLDRILMPSFVGSYFQEPLHLRAVPMRNIRTVEHLVKIHVQSLLSFALSSV